MPQNAPASPYLLQSWQQIKELHSERFLRSLATGSSRCDIIRDTKESQGEGGIQDSAVVRVSMVSPYSRPQGVSGARDKVYWFCGSDLCNIWVSRNRETGGAAWWSMLFYR